MEKDDYTASGYSHPQYAKSFMEYGTLIELPKSKGWILKRQIPGFPAYDAMGCYPLFTCQEWSKLWADLENIGDELVSLSMVVDPFGEYDLAYLHQCFKDVVIPFKKHFFVNLSKPMESFVSLHHRRYARKSLRDLDVARCENPAEILGEWTRLYTELIKRHNIRGLLKFSRNTFAKQLRVPGINVFRASYKGTTVGALLWYVQGEVGYYHLGASSSLGYDLRASFALFWTAIEYFKSLGLGWLNLGAGAGFNDEGNDGLSRFKQGWSTGTHTAYFCGVIFDPEKYREIVKDKCIPNTNYFPAYRLGEFS